MARRCDARKDAEWGKRLKRFRRSGLTVARFCAEEHVSVASFYYWYKKLGQTASRRRSRLRPGVFQQVAVVPARTTLASDMPVVGRDTPAAVPAPREVVATTRAMTPVAAAHAPRVTKVSIQLPCGTRIEMDGGQLDMVRAVVGEVARAYEGVQAGKRPC
jgi:hypothetical protein